MCEEAKKVDSIKSPFISGYDRFAVHGDISAEMAGGLLVSELNCTACHTTSNPVLTPKSGPVLDDVTSRLNPDWMRKFLAEPQVHKTGTTMPDMFKGMPAEARDEMIEHLIAFFEKKNENRWPELKASGLDPIPDQFWLVGNAERGKVLYHQVGCVACHAPDSEYPVAKSKPSPLDQLLETLTPEEIREMGLTSAVRDSRSIPHPEIEKKYNAKSLSFFLYKPDHYRPGSRMPAVKLKAMEAADIATWLLRKGKNNLETPVKSPGDPEIGEKFFVKSGCANCHQLESVKPQQNPKSWDKLDFSANNNCLAAAKPHMPHYDLDEQMKKSVASIAGQKGEKKKFDPLESAQATMLKFNCYACHERDKAGGPARNIKPYFLTMNDVDLGDEGRIPPMLTGVGKKLQPNWLKVVLAGQGDIRPHMLTRMPVFQSPQVQSLVQNFSKGDGASTKNENEVFKSGSDLPQAGVLLMDTGCVQCHQFNQELVPGVVGVDLDGINTRVQAEWFRDFLLDPNSRKAGTRMPTFFPNGKSSNPHVLNGDPELQVAAMWAYLKDLKKQPVPSKIIEAKSQDFELKPVDKPVILRTFMREAGTHAIAVGFPQGVHFTFDAENLRLAEAWRGRFIDARNTWFMRLIPPTDPLGNEHVSISAVPSFALLDKQNETWPAKLDLTQGKFLGYSLDKKKIPTFKYQLQGYTFEERLEPVKFDAPKIDTEKTNTEKTDSVKYHFLRKIIITPPDQLPRGTLYFHLLADKKLEKISNTSYKNSAGLVVSVQSEPKNIDPPKHSGEISQWLLNINSAKATTLEVRYSW